MLELLDRRVETTVLGSWSERVTNDPAIAPYLLAGTRLEAFGRLRYQLFVERDGKAYAHADHANRVLLEPADRVSLNFGVAKNGECLVGVRLTKGTDADIDEQLSNLLARFGELPTAHVMLNSRMTVGMAGQMFIPAVLRQVYRAALLSDALYGLIAARASVAPLFQRFGYIARGTIHTPVAGELVALCLDLYDRENMEDVRSPLLRTLLEHLDLHKRVPSP